MRPTPPSRWPTTSRARVSALRVGVSRALKWEARVLPALTRERRGGLWPGKRCEVEKIYLRRSMLSREPEVHLFGHSRDFVGDGGSVSDPAPCAGLRGSTIYSLDSSLRAAAAPKGNRRVTEYGNRREHQPAPGEDSTGASAEREGDFDPPQPKTRRARGEYKGAREVLKYWHDTAAPPSRGGVARGDRC
jgi:hypothetical protein